MAAVAKAVGVSIHTLSAVISDKPGMAAATRELVRQVIKDLDADGATQEGIQAGVGLKKTAPQVARDIQAAFDKLLKSGYRFAH